MKNKNIKKNFFTIIINFIKKIFRTKKKEEKNSDDIYPMW